MTAKEIFDKLRRDSKKVNENTIVYLSGTKNMKTRVEKEFKKWYDDLILDNELKIINIKDYEKQIETIKKSIENMVIY